MTNLLFYAYLYSLPNSTVGVDAIAKQTISLFPGFTSMMLFFIFLVVFLGGIARQKTRTGTADYSAWAILASISTLLLALLFSVSSGFISLDVLVIVVTLNILSAIWFFLDKRVTEV